MNRHLGIKFIFTYLIAFQVIAGCTLQPTEQSDTEVLKEHVEWLAHDDRLGRLSGSFGEADAANYISDYFAQTGLEPQGKSGTYLQQFTLTGEISEAMGVMNNRARNVLGAIRGEAYPERYIVVGAHYDGQGTGGVISMNSEATNIIHPSADDNASGTAVMMLLAERFASEPAQVTILFAAFSGEEQGMLGSKHFMYEFLDGNVSAFGMINLDMVGRMTESEVSIYGTESGNRWKDILSRIEMDSLNVITTTSRQGSSDHVPFHNAGIPAVHYHTGMHVEYHTEQDTADKLNINGMKKVADHAEKLIRELAKEDPDSFRFGEMNRQPNPVIEPGTPTLGLLPDYLFRGIGMRIDEVTSGEKADAAGLQSGDIIKGLNGITISNIFDYMDALKSISDNESVELKYQRNEQQNTVIIPF
jgi:hypothetical protein